MKWDFSIYPEMTEAQCKAISSVGLTLLGVQGCEHAINFMLHWVFPSDLKLDLKALAAMGAEKQKRTLGQLLVELRKRVEVHPHFDSMLVEFLALRNRFVHRIFNEGEFSLATDDSCARAEEIMLQLQCLTWDIQNLVMSYNLLWVECIPELTTFHQQALSESKHLQQVRANLKPVFIPKT